MKFSLCLPDFTSLSKQKKAHPGLIPDAKDPARLHVQACGGPKPEGPGGQGPLWNLEERVSLLQAIDQIDLPPEIAIRRVGESYHEQTLRALPHILSALVLRFGEIPEELSPKDYRFLTEMILWSKRNRAIKELEQRRRNLHYEDPPDDAV